jgi:nucleoside 2-deoxyribosyltransferase
MTSITTRAYLASPLGFATSTEAFMAELKAALGTLVTVDNPWDFGGPELGEAFARAHALPGHDERRDALHAINMGIAAKNEAAIRGCDLVIAVLDGVDVDSGTASEIGFAAGLGKPSFGLRTDSRLAGDNLGSRVNLQVEYWIEAGGGQIVGDTAALLAALRDWLATH